MHRLTRFLGFAIVGGFAVACAFALRADLAQVSFAPMLRSWDLVLLAASFSLMNYALRIVRWRQYLARLGHSIALGFTSLSYVAGFAFTVSPGKVGEMARARYYSRIGITLPDVAGAFFVERLMDLLAMLVLAVLILAVAPRYHAAIWAAGGIIAIALVSLAVLPWAAIADALRASPRIPRPLARLAVGAAGALGAARSLLSPGMLLSGFCIGLLAWGLEGLGLYTLGSMFPPAHVAVAVGVGIYAVAVLVGALSFLPGGLGSTEAIMTALLTAQGYPMPDALLITIVCRILTLWLAVGIGWAAVFILRHRLVEAVVPWQ
jgi:uncharacterized membrane protein YbhN (UPF0104 family)